MHVGAPVSCRADVTGVSLPDIVETLPLRVHGEVEPDPLWLAERRITGVDELFIASLHGRRLDRADLFAISGLSMRLYTLTLEVEHKRLAVDVSVSATRVCVLALMKQHEVTKLTNPAQ